MNCSEDTISTHQSLLSGLNDWGDEKSWLEFVETYWRLIYNTELKPELNADESQDVVQGTIQHASSGLKYNSPWTGTTINEIQRITIATRFSAPTTELKGRFKSLPESRSRSFDLLRPFDGWK